MKMLTLLHISTEKTEELKFLRERIEAELARRELVQRQENRSPAMVDERSRRSGTLRLERVKCGKDHCKKCAEGGGHGPYWYLYFRRHGKLTSHYIGKELPSELRAIRRAAYE
jgi:hypothetical protein